MESFFLLLSVGMLLKLVYLLAAQVWRVDIYFHIQSAKTILDGGVLFKDFGNSHPAGIVFLHWSLIQLFGYENISIALKVTALLSQTIAAFILYKIIYSFYDKTIGLVISLIFLLALAINWELWPANIMLFYILPVFAGIYVLVLNQEKQRFFSYFLAGICFSISTLLSTNTIFYTLLVPAFSIYRNRSFKYFFLHSIAGFLGFLIPFAINMAYFIYNDALIDYYNWNILWGAIYAGYRPWYERIFVAFPFSLIKTWAWFPLYIVFGYGVYHLVREKLYRNNAYAFFALALFAVALLSRLGMVRSNIRYSLFLLPGLIIMLPIAWNYFKVSKHYDKKKQYGYLLVLFIIFALAQTNLKAYRVSRYYVDYNRKNLHEWVISNSDKDDSIFVWHEGYEIYYRTGRKMATGIFSTSEFLESLSAWKADNFEHLGIFYEKFIEEFKRDKPLLVIDLKPDFRLKNKWKRENKIEYYFQKFYSYFKEHYEMVKIIDGAKIYRRIN